MDQENHENKEPQLKLHIHAPERTAKSVFKDAGRQIVASAVFLVVGFLLMNWSAYTQIAQNEWNKLTGNEMESPLTQLAANSVTSKYKVLEMSNNPEIQKRQIPELNMEIVPPDDRLVIPRIDKNLPIIKPSSASLIDRDWETLEKDMQEALRDGVVHYPGTSLPGNNGNFVITGHSSYFPWDSGRFKDVFALLHEVVLGDKIVVYFDQEKYIYEVTDIKTISPSELEVLQNSDGEQITLVTCSPVGTNLKRLIVTAKPISEDPKVLRN
jgi:LPXTG-site transpeptidase (sortase) family protein